MERKSHRDSARPTGDMSASESHEYAKEFQQENFGIASNVGEGRAGDPTASAQSTIQNQKGIPNQFNDNSQIEHEAEKDSQYSNSKGTINKYGG